MYSETFVSLLWHERNVLTLPHGVIIDGVMGAYLHLNFQKQYAIRQWITAPLSGE